MSWGRVSSSDRLHRADQRTGSEHTLSCFLPCRSGIVAFGSASGATGSRTRTSQSAERVSLPAVGACAAPLSTGPVSRQVEPAISTLEAELSKTQRPRGGSQAQPARLERPMTSPEVERAALRAYAECEVDQRALESCVSWFSARRYAVSVTGPTGHGGARKKPDVACDTGLWSSEGAAKCHKRKGCPRSAFAQSSAMRPWHRGSAVKLDHNEIIGPLAWFGGADAPDEQRARASRTLSIADRRPSPSESSHFFSFWHSPRSMRSPIAKKRQNPLPSKGFGTLRPRWAIMGRNHQWRGQDLNLRPRGYEPRELPDCSTPRHGGLSEGVRSADFVRPYSITLSAEVEANASFFGIAMNAAARAPGKATARVRGDCALAAATLFSSTTWFAGRLPSRWRVFERRDIIVGSTSIDSLPGLCWAEVRQPAIRGEAMHGGSKPRLAASTTPRPIGGRVGTAHPPDRCGSSDRSSAPE